MRHDDRGTATVLLVALLFLVLSAASVGAALSRFAMVRADVSAAADLAALEAAATLDCQRAASSALANRASLVSCRTDGTDVVVSVARDVELVMGHRIRVVAWARAGPP